MSCYELKHLLLILQMKRQKEISEDDIIEVLKKENIHVPYDIKIHPKKGWVLPNRVKFPNWIDTTFKYKQMKHEKCVEKGTCRKDLFPRQHIVKDFMQYASPYRGLLLFHGLGVGKCHGINTPILMFDGTIKMVQDVKVNDLIMGDDSSPKHVISLTSGRDEMYSISNGQDSFTANSAHILCLKHKETGIVHELEVTQYLNLPVQEQQQLCSFKGNVDFFYQDLNHHDPYLFGLWLGNKKNTTEKNVILSSSKALYYMSVNTKDVRLKVLSGLIDSCILENIDNDDDSYVVTTDIQYIKTMTKFIGDTLGFNVRIDTDSLYISGKGIENIPIQQVKKKTSSLSELTQITVTSNGIGKYFGFMIDGNHRYLLGDCTVTHNSAASIACSEVLMNYMPIVIMLPASLKNNFINEVKEYGRSLYHIDEHWELVPFDEVMIKLDAICQILSIPPVEAMKLFKNANGLWIPVSGKVSNYKNLDKEQQENITQQIDFLIDNRYEFINFNGLNMAKVQKWKEHNPFDNKCIIIDEVHNLISKIINGSRNSIGKMLYRLLMKAQNCKIIALSGTPIQNNPFELAFLINIITGKKSFYNIIFKDSTSFNDSKLEELLKNNKHIDFYVFDAHSKNLEVTFLPKGFIKSSTSAIYSQRSEEDVDVMAEFLKTLKENKFAIKKKNENETTVLPDNEEDFTNYFISPTESSVINKNMFMKRILGTISYFNEYSPELYPDKESINIDVPMSDYQYSIYIKSRIRERKTEMQKSANSDNMSTVYRSYSRQNCNFVFPEGITKPTKNNKTAKETIRETDEEEEDEEEIKDVTYLSKLKHALETIKQRGFLSIEKLNVYAPKFNEIIKRLENKGKSLVYSQFDTVEGMSLFKLTLEDRDYKEFKLKKTEGKWDIKDDLLSDPSPKYFQFRTNEESKILLQIFNSDFGNLPPLIKEKIGKFKYTNLYGELLKVILITKSGAEGISCKHVRYVHIMEPYWNPIRINQVIGRAVRTKSHTDLPKSEQNVKAFVYCSSFTKSQKDNKLTSQDQGVTTDQHLFNIAKRKEHIIDEFQDLMKKASMDCALNGKSHPSMKCFSYPTNQDEDHLAYNHNIVSDFTDDQLKNYVKENTFKGTVMKTRVGNFIVRENTDEVYDYDIYMQNKKLVLMGTLVKREENGKIIYTIDLEKSPENKKTKKT